MMLSGMGSGSADVFRMVRMIVLLFFFKFKYYPFCQLDELFFKKKKKKKVELLLSILTLVWSCKTELTLFPFCDLLGCFQYLISNSSICN